MLMLKRVETMSGYRWFAKRFKNFEEAKRMVGDGSGSAKDHLSNGWKQIRTDDTSIGDLSEFRDIVPPKCFEGDIVMVQPIWHELEIKVASGKMLVEPEIPLPLEGEMAIIR